VEGPAADHLKYDVGLPAAVGVLDRGLEVGRVAVDGGVGAKLSRELALLVAGRRCDDAAGSPQLGELDGERANAAGAGVHDDRLPGLQVRRGAQDVPRRRALRGERERLPVVDAIGDREDELGARDGALGVSAAVEHCDDARAVLRRPGDLGPGDDRECRRGEVGVLRLVRVGVVDAGGGDVDQDPTVGGRGVVELAQPQHLGPAELRDLDRSHRRIMEPNDRDAAFGAAARWPGLQRLSRCDSRRRR
jgi:hypothetical protein